MQSGKFFSDETLRDLGILNEDTSQNLTTGESQIDEAPLGFAAGLGQRALATLGIGQSTRAAAKGKLEVGKIANQMYSGYYKWLQTQTPAIPSKDNILAFLQSKGIPTANASKVLTQAETDNAAKEMSKVQSQAEKENKLRDQAATKKDKFTKPMKTTPFDTSPVRGVTEWKELNDILKLSGLPEVMIEALSNDQISKAFTAASGDYISNQQAATQAASPQDATTQAAATQAAATQAASPQDTTSEKSTASSRGGGGGTIDNSMAEFNSWLEKNKSNLKILNQAKTELEKVIASTSQSAASSQEQSAKAQGLVRAG